MTLKKPRPAYGKENSPCPLCDLILPSKQERFFHVENVHYPGQGEEVKGVPHIYSRICGKRSMTPSDITEHNEKYHPEHLRFACDLCPGKKFVQHTQLDAHKVIHLSKGGPFKSLLCPPGDELSFTEATDLEKHLGRVHTHHIRWRNGVHQTKVKNQIPGVCDNPKLHEKGVKGLMSKFGPCRYCGVKLTKEKDKGLWGLRNHERSEHPEEFKWECPSCKNTLTEEVAMATCEETHKENLETYQCGLCVLK